MIGVTSRVPDVDVTSKTIRPRSPPNGIVAFVFNAALLALTVNLAANAI